MKSDEQLNLDALLGGWPSPPREEAAWEEGAEAIVGAAIAAKGSAPEGTRALFDVPALEPEPGEPTITPNAPKEQPVTRVSSFMGTGRGDTPMSDETKDEGSESRASVPGEAPKKKLSLKEITARAAQGTSITPPPPTAAPATRPASIPPARPVEASSDDSGMVDLRMIHAMATAQQVAAAAAAKPASSGLFDDDPAPQAPVAAPVARVAPAPTPAPAAATAAPKESGKSSGIGIGIVAALAIAAGGMMYVRTVNRPTAPSSDANRAPAAAVVAQTPATQLEAKKADTPSSPTLMASAAPSAAAAAAPAGPAVIAAAAPAQAVALADTGNKAPAAEDKSPAAAAPPAAATPAPGSDKPTDLASAMAKAAGADAKGSSASAATEPAAGGKASGNTNLPEQPSQGSVSSAMGSVMGGAKACVAGADDVSRAQVTFASGGTVSSVSVSGWAAGKGAAGCIKSALKGAKVGAFSKPTFTVGVTIRP